MKVLYASTLPIEDDSNLSASRQPRMFRESAKKFGITAYNINLGGDKCDSRDYWLSLWRKYLVPLGNELVLLTDAWDVCFLAGIDEIEQKFDSFGAQVVFGMEANKWPPTQLDMVGKFPEAPTRFRYINGGVLLGYANSILDLYHKCWRHNSDNNQYWLNRNLILNPELAHSCDYHCEIFQCLYPSPGETMPIDLLEIRETRLYNNETHSLPCLLHGNGGYAEVAMKLWEKMR